MSEDKERLHAAPLWIVFLTSLVFLALSGMFWFGVSRLELVTAVLWLRAVPILLFQTTTFAQFLGFLEELVEVKLSDNVLLGMKFALYLQSMWMWGCFKHNLLSTKLCVIKWAYLIEGPRYSSPFMVHHWTSHNLLPSLEKHQGRQLFSQRRSANLVPVQK